MKKKIQRTTGFADSTIEVQQRAEGDEKPDRIIGLAVPFNKKTTIENFFTEEFSPGAFTKTLIERNKKNRDILALTTHDTNNLLGRTFNNTLRLTETKRGLEFEIELPDTQLARDTMTQVRRGDLAGASPRFIPVKQELDESKKLPHYIVREAELIEVSLVPNPAYTNTTAQEARSILESCKPEDTETPNEEEVAEIPESTPEETIDHSARAEPVDGDSHSSVDEPGAPDNILSEAGAKVAKANAAGLLCARALAARKEIINRGRTTQKDQRITAKP